MGKGSKRRPQSISSEEFSKRWDMAFGKHAKRFTIEKMPHSVGGASVKCEICGEEIYESEEYFGVEVGRSDIDKVTGGLVHVRCWKKREQEKGR